MIFVFVNPYGDLVTSNTRWNHHSVRNYNVDHAFSADELTDLLGVNFYQVFKPYSKEELKAKGTVLSDVIGTVYEKDGKRGIVAAVDENDNPTLLMGLEDALVPDENGDGCSWYDAMKLKPENGWRVGTKEDWEQVKPNWKQLVRNVKKNLNQDLMMTDDQEWYKWYWTSSECSSARAWRFYAGYGDLGYDRKVSSSEGSRVRCFCDV